MDAVLDDLAEALGALDPMVAALTAPEWSRPTPCSAWTVRDVVAHLTTGHEIAAAIVRATPVPARDSADEERPAAHRAAAYEVLAAFGEPCVLTRSYRLPLGTVPGAVAVQLRTVEALVHGWDLAEATARSLAVREELAGRALAFATGMRARLPPGRTPFAPARPVSASDSAMGRLVSLLGRGPLR